MNKSEHIRELTELTIEAVLTRWPETAAVFHKHRMACVGCTVAPFYTVVDAASVYGMAPETFAAELVEAIQQERESSGSE